MLMRFSVKKIEKLVQEKPLMELEELLDLYYNTTQKLKTLEKRHKFLNKLIKEKAVSYPPKTLIGEYVVNVQKAETSRISREMLVELGVPEDIIEQATVRSEYYKLIVDKVKKVTVK